MFLSVYNNKQGMIVRWGTFIATGILAIFGAYRFYYYGLFATTPLEKMSEFWKWLHPTGMSVERQWSIFTIPAVSIDIPLSPRWFITIGLGLILLLISAYFCFRHQRVSDFLIDTESEMRKVSWPTISEVSASSIVVIIVIALLGVYLFLIDIGLSKALFRWVFF